jgi:hypothetical protein
VSRILEPADPDGNFLVILNQTPHSFETGMSRCQFNLRFCEPVQLSPTSATDPFPRPHTALAKWWEKNIDEIHSDILPDKTNKMLTDEVKTCRMYE